MRRKREHVTSELHCTACGHTFWMNSKPTASVLLVHRNTVLLVRRACAPYKHWWDIPGGFLDVHEDPLRGLQRELREELGIRVHQPKFLNIALGYYPSTPPQSTLNINYYATRFTGTLRPQDDVASYAWHALDALPKNIAFANNRHALRELKKLLRL